jgi:hypothetical protein
MSSWPTREVSLGWRFTTQAQFRQFRDEIFMGSRGGAIPIIFIASDLTQGLDYPLYGMLQETFAGRRIATTGSTANPKEFWDVEAEIVEQPFPITVEESWRYPEKGPIEADYAASLAAIARSTTARTPRLLHSQRSRFSSEALTAPAPELEQSRAQRRGVVGLLNDIQNALGRARTGVDTFIAMLPD